MRRNRPDPVRGAANALDGIANVFDLFGFADAARNLRHFRSGQGTPQNFSDAEMEDHDPVLDAEDTNRTRFESQTFTGNTDRSEALLDLEDGETITFSDEFQRRIFGENFDTEPFLPRGALRGLPPFVPPVPSVVAPILNQSLDAVTTVGDAAPNPSTFLAFGRDEVLSQGGFEAAREGGRITIRGTVRNGFDTDSNVFDFHEGQPGARSAHILEDHQARTGEPAAAPFRFQFDRQQDVEAIARKTDDGLVLEKVTWGDIR